MKLPLLYFELPIAMATQKRWVYITDGPLLIVQSCAFICQPQSARPIRYALLGTQNTWPVRLGLQLYSLAPIYGSYLPSVVLKTLTFSYRPSSASVVVCLSRNSTNAIFHTPS